MWHSRVLLGPCHEQHTDMNVNRGSKSRGREMWLFFLLLLGLGGKKERNWTDDTMTRNKWWRWYDIDDDDGEKKERFSDWSATRVYKEDGPRAQRDLAIETLFMSPFHQKVKRRKSSRDQPSLSPIICSLEKALLIYTSTQLEELRELLFSCLLFVIIITRICYYWINQNWPGLKGERQPWHDATGIYWPRSSSSSSDRIVISLIEKWILSCLVDDEAAGISPSE